MLNNGSDDGMAARGRAALGTLGLIALLGGAAVGLTGCKKPAGAASSAASGASSGASATADDKLNAYVDAYNKLVGTFGLEDTYHDYREREISKASPTDNILVSNGTTIDQARDALKQARAMSGAVPPDLDAAADKLLAALDKADTRIDGLYTYYSSKAYKEDGLARGKREDPLMLADFAAADSALDAFDTILDRELTKRDQAELAKLKNGDPLLYDAKLALSQAKSVLNIFHGSDDLANPARLSDADAKIAALEQTLAALRAEEAKAKAAGKSPAVEYGLIDNYLTSMIGAYRTAKQSHRAQDFQSAVDSYNNAISQSNDIK